LKTASGTLRKPFFAVRTFPRGVLHFFVNFRCHFSARRGGAGKRIRFPAFFFLPIRSDFLRNILLFVAVFFCYRNFFALI